MKRKYLSMGILVFMITISVHAQIEEEIKTYVDSTEIIVNNGRKLMVAKLMDHDYDKAKEIYQYLNTITSDRNYVAFNYSEKLLSDILWGDWHTLMKLLLDYSRESKKTVYPNTFEIMTTLYNRVLTSSDSLLNECKKTDLDDESKGIIDIIMSLIKNGSNDWGYSKKLEAFEKVYAPSRYQDFIDNYLPAKKIKASVGWSVGSGMIFPTKSLGENFSSNATVNITMDVKVRKIYSSLYLNGSWPKLKIPFTATNGTDTLSFEKNEGFDYFDAGLKGGFSLLSSKNFQINPYVSISGSYLRSNRFEPEERDREYEIFNAFSCGVGLHAEYRIVSLNSPSIYYGYMRNYLSIKVETGYNYVSKFKDEYYKGNIFYITAALVWAIGDF